MFSADHPGIRMNGPGFTSLQLDSDRPSGAPRGYTTIRGYLSFDDIDAILNNPECVGLRIYNSANQQGDPRIIASGIDAFGEDFKVEYLVGHVGAKADHSIPTLRKDRFAEQATSSEESEGKEEAEKSVEEIALDGFTRLRGTNKSISSFVYSAFFSRASIDTLRNSNLSGIIFLDTRLNTIPAEVLNEIKLLLNIKSATRINRLRTLTAVASNLQDDGSIGAINMDNPIHIVSDLPCPGYCITIGRNKDSNFKSGHFFE